MNLKTAATFVYGILVGVGGAIGFVKAGSVASLVMGSVFAMLLLVCAYAMYRESILAYFSTIVLSSLLACFFAYRLFSTQAFMPSGLMLILSIAMIAILCVKQKSPETAL